MSQHFLLSAGARTLSFRDVLQLSDEEVQLRMAEARWGRRDQQACPHCGVIDTHRHTPRQHRWRCKHCYKAFSVTSGTVFHCHKLPLKLIYAAMALYASAVKGISALQLCRDLGVQYKTAFVLLHKLRETIFQAKDAARLKGTIQMDGAYVHTYVRPKNRKKDRVDRRKAVHQNKHKCVVVVLREMAEEKGQGAVRSKVVVLPAEDEAYIRPTVEALVEPGSVIVTDEAPGYTVVGLKHEHRVVCHAEEYQSKEGINQNQAESFFSRIRRMFIGQLHHTDPRYLDVYAQEIAYREDLRRVDNGGMVADLLKKCLRRGPSRDFCSYWQGNHRRHGSLAMAPVAAATPPPIVGPSLSPAT